MKKRSFRAFWMIIVIIGLVVGCAVNRRYEEGMAALNADRYLDAVRAFEDARRIDPDRLDIRLALQQARRAEAGRLIERAEAARRTGDVEQAKRWFEEALLMDVAVPGIREGLQRLERRQKAGVLFAEAISLADSGQMETARRYLTEVIHLDPDLQEAHTVLKRLETIAAASSPSTAPAVSFEFQDTRLGDVFTALGSVASTNLLIDETVNPDQRITAMIQEADVWDAMQSLAAAHSLIVIDIAPGTVMLAKDTRENRERYRREDVGLFSLRYADAERMKKLLEPMAGSAVILADTRTNSIVIRSEAKQMSLIRDVISALDIRESEVLVDVEIIEVSRNRIEDLGMDLGDDPVVGVSIRGPIRASGTPGNLTINQLQSVNRGQVFMTLPSLYLNLLKRDGETRTLAQPRLRILNRTTARLHIGEQVPIKKTSSLFRDTSEEQSSYDYRNIGIVMNLTPRILSETELSLDLKLEVSSILQTSDDGHPTIGTREVETTLRLRDGEVEMIAGLLKDEERTGTTRIPLLGDIPVLGRLFASEQDDVNQTDIIISLIPHIMDPRLISPEQHLVWRGIPGPSRDTREGAFRRSESVGDEADRIVIDEGMDGNPDGARTAMGESGVSGTEDEDALEQAARVWIRPPDATVAIGESTAAMVSIADAQDVGSIPFYIEYDPNILEIVQVSEEPFLGSDGSPTAFMASIDDRRGRIVIGLSRVGATGGISGSG
ncbi:hypothetical protein JXA80_09490, partial [bacterium]|nr:hypothetical protein [candidate division CSSED10-310 bacterium]